MHNTPLKNDMKMGCFSCKGKRIFAKEQRIPRSNKSKISFLIEQEIWYGIHYTLRHSL
jgi:hypothetical protein